MQLKEQILNAFNEIFEKKRIKNKKIYASKN